jgi:O-antigen ligase
MTENALRNPCSFKSIRVGLVFLADGFAVWVAVSLPWSTSATGVLIVLWLLALLPTVDAAALQREVATLAGGLPVLLWLLAAFGMLWAEVDWSQRVGDMGAFHKLLAIPLLLYQFRASDQGKWVLIGFLISCVALLAVSWAFAFYPSIAWRWMKFPGVPVKDYILQSGEFLSCAFAGAYLATVAWKAGRRMLALALVSLSIGFIANILYVSLGRTTLVAMPVLVAVVGWRHWRVRGILIGGSAVAIAAAIVWSTSPYLRERVITLQQEITLYNDLGLDSPAGKRLEFWRKSIHFINAAPILGHGTGSIRALFVEAQGGATSADAVVSVNPHNQMLAVAIQLGLAGAAILAAMWIAHFLMFRAEGVSASIGLLVVTQNVISSLFNSHLNDFTQGWIYVFGVGVLGGVVLRRSATPASKVQVV